MWREYNLKYIRSRERSLAEGKCLGLSVMTREEVTLKHERSWAHFWEAHEERKALSMAEAVSSLFYSNVKAEKKSEEKASEKKSLSWLPVLSTLCGGEEKYLRHIRETETWLLLPDSLWLSVLHGCILSEEEDSMKRNFRTSVILQAWSCYSAVLWEERKISPEDAEKCSI